MGITGEEKIQMAVRLGKGPTPYYSYRRDEQTLITAHMQAGAIRVATRGLVVHRDHRRRGRESPSGAVQGH